MDKGLEADLARNFSSGHGDHSRAVPGDAATLFPGFPSFRLACDFPVATVIQALADAAGLFSQQSVDSARQLGHNRGLRSKKAKNSA